jgi:hypothetical protein
MNIYIVISKMKCIVKTFLLLLVLVLFNNLLSYSQQDSKIANQNNEIQGLNKSSSRVRKIEGSGVSWWGKVTTASGQIFPGVTLRLTAPSAGTGPSPQPYCNQPYDQTTTSYYPANVQGLFVYNYTFSNIYSCNNRYYTVVPTRQYYTFIPAARQSVYPDGYIITDYDFVASKFPYPNLIYPANGTTGLPQNLNLIWSKVDGAKRYRIQVDTTATFNSSSLIDVTQDSTVGSGNQLYSLSNLVVGKKYFWRVQSIIQIWNSPALYDTSDWSPTYNFRTLLASPTLSSPVDNYLGTSLTPTLYWNVVDGAESYRLQVSTNSNFTSLVYNGISTTSSQTLSGLSYNTVYYWRVCARSGQGDSSAWSSVWSFKTKLEAPTLNSPNDGSYAISINPTSLIWNSVSGASNYRVQLALDNGFTQILKDSIVTLSTTRDYWGLSNGTNYFWRVKAYSASITNGDSSDWSGTRAFMTKLALPVHLAPANDGYTSRNPLLTWTQSVGKTSYTVQYIKDGTNDTITTYNVLTEAFGLAGLEVGAKYYWRVKAKNAGDSTQWTQHWSFNVTGFIPVLYAPNNGKKINSIDTTLVWLPVPNATQYAIDYSFNSSFTSPTTTTQAPQNGNTGYQILNVNFDENDPSMYYRTVYWRVRAFVNGQWTENSSEWSYITKINKPSLLYPTNSATNISTKPTFSWQIVPGAETYNIQVSTSRSDWSSPIINQNVSASIYTSTISLSPGVYYWRVKAFNSSGQISDYSDVWSFTATKWKISGTVTIQGNGAFANCKIYLNDGSINIDSTFTNASGNYEFYANGDGNYILMPQTQPGYTFIPNQRNINNLSSDYPMQDFTATLNIYKISGTIYTPTGTLDGVTVKLSNGNTTFSSNGGKYEFLVSALSDYTVTPEKTGYNISVFGSSDSTINSILGDSILNFYASLKKFKISGRVFDGGVPLANAVVVLSGSSNSTYTTDLNGYYEFSNLDALGTYSVAPSTISGAGAGKIFVPASVTFSNLLKDETQDFVSGVSLKLVSGRLKTRNNQGVNSIAIRIYSSGFNTSAITTNQSGNDGFYSAYVPANDLYTIEPVISPDPGYTYYSTDPPHGKIRTVNVIDDTPNQDFIVDTTVYKISGYVTLNNTIYQNGVPVQIDTVTGSKVINTYNNGISDGYYEFFVRGLQSVTVKVVSTQYSYSPALQTWDYLIGDKVQNFNATGADLKRYIISGIITNNVGVPLTNVSVKINNGDTSVITNVNGFYSVTVNAGGSYSITPELAGYVFTPTPPIIFTNIDSDKSQNFIGTPQTSTISGYVINYDSSYLSGVTVTCDNGFHQRSIVTDASGFFIFTVRADSNYVIYPTKSGVIFNPNNRNYNHPYQNLTNQNFKAELNAYTVNGFVYYQGTSIGVKNVNLNITGNPSVITTTNTNGEYTFTAFAGQSYSVEASLAGYTITSSAGNPQNTGIITGNKTLVNFYASAKKHIISGTVFDVDGITPLSGVTVTCPGGSLQAPFTGITGPDGNYSFMVDEAGVYTVTPEKNGILFSPGNRVYINPQNDYLNQNYKAELSGYIVDGYVKKDGIGLKEVIISYSSILGDGLTITDDNGYYKFTAAAGVTYSVRATKAGYNITSSAGNPQSTGTINSNKRLVDFYAVSDKYTISGKVWFGTTGLAGVKINCPGATNSPTITDQNGNYSLTVDAFNDYVITPELSGFAFTPSSHSISNVTTNITGKDFYASMTEVPILVAPANGTLGAPTNPILIWNPVTGATSYTIQYSTDYQFSTYTSLNSNATTIQLSGLQGQTTYFWRVRAIGPGGTTGWSAIWLFRTSGGHIEVEPAAINYEPTLVGRVRSSSIIIYNKGVSPLRVSNITISGPDASSFKINVPVPISLNGGTSYIFAVDFQPQRTGILNAKVLIDHNDASTEVNPIEIPLIGTGVLTLATIDLPKEIDFGTVPYRSGYVERTFNIGNNSPVPEDILVLNSYYFQKSDNLFQVMQNFPISVNPGSVYAITVRFNPEQLGRQENYLHILNTSSNLPDGVILVKANVIQGDLIVTPSQIDFGHTSKGVPYKDSIIMIQNNSSQNITITAKWISGDTSSFTIDNDKVITLRPNQSDFIVVRFYPHTSGRKNARFNITSDYSLTPALYVPLTGIGGEEAVISVNRQLIDFGILRKGQVKDTTLEIKNDGSLDLIISSMILGGTNKEIFSLVNVTQPLILRGGETKKITIRATGILPVGPKSGSLQINSNDKTQPSLLVDLLATVKSNVLFKATDKIEFDTVDIGYYKDTVIIFKNYGDLPANISNLYIDGPFLNEFFVINNPQKITLIPGDSVSITLRFSPLVEGLRYARLVLHVDDPIEPIQYIILKGYGRKPIANISTSGGINDEEIIDFGTVPIFETRTKGFSIFNNSKFSKLRIDSMYYDPIELQPFYYSGFSTPSIIQPKSRVDFYLNFNPHDKVNSYIGYLNILYRDSTESASQNKVLRVKMIGRVIFPGGSIKLTPVLKFGKVLIGESKSASFEFTNLGISYLRIDSMALFGEDAKEFRILQESYPITIMPNEVASSTASFTPKKPGSKDAFIKVYWNDLFVEGKIEIWAEGITTGSEVLSVKTNEIPVINALYQNYPNPFNPSTVIKYSITETTPVKVKVYNSVGQEIAILLDETQSPGVYQLEWTAKNIASGVYFYKIETNKFNSIKKMLLVK